MTRSAIQQLPLFEEALLAVETAAGTTSEWWRNTPEHETTMALKPLRGEGRTAVQARLRATSEEAPSERRAMGGASGTRGDDGVGTPAGRGTAGRAGTASG